MSPGIPRRPRSTHLTRTHTSPIPIPLPIPLHSPCPAWRDGERTVHGSGAAEGRPRTPYGHGGGGGGGVGMDAEKTQEIVLLFPMKNMLVPASSAKKKWLTVASSAATVLVVLAGSFAPSRGDALGCDPAQAAAGGAITGYVKLYASTHPVCQPLDQFGTPAFLDNLRQLRQAAFTVAGPLYTTFLQVRSMSVVLGAYAEASRACGCLVRLEADAALPMGGVYGYYNPEDRSVHVPVAFSPPSGIVGELPLILHELQHAIQDCTGSSGGSQCMEEQDAENVATVRATMPHYAQFIGNADVDNFLCALLF